MKYLMIFAVMLLAFPIAFADTTFYDMNDTVNILAEYRVNGVLTTATARLSIFLPDGSVAPTVNNVSMANISTGRFDYDFNCTIRGEHEAVAIFRNSSGDDVGIDSSTFRCGDPAVFDFGGVCPTTTNGLISMWIILIILVIIAIIGAIANFPILNGISGFILLLAGISTVTCGDIIAYFSIIFGIVFMIIAVANIKY